MAILNKNLIETHHKFMAMLCKAAGVEHCKVRSINVSATHGEYVEFGVEMFGRDEHLQLVLGESAQICADETPKPPKPPDPDWR